jgi:dipeptidyl aminopeptidase/acylaminoacyl peptidase
MKIYKLLSLIIALSVSQYAISKNKLKPYPLDVFAQRSSISNIELSPNGEKLALLRISEKEGNPVLEIYDTNDLTKPPYRVDAKPMEVTGYGWVSDKDIILSLRQKIRKKIDGFNEGVYGNKIAKLDLRKNKIKSIDEPGAEIVNLLPNKPNKIIFGINAEKKPGSKVPNSIRPKSYYELNLKTMAKKLLLRARISLSSITFDSYGNPRLGFGFDESTDELVNYYREVNSKKWNEFHRQHIDKFDSFEVWGIDNSKPDTVFVIAHNGENTKALWEFNVKSKTYGEKIYGRSDIDIWRLVGHSDTWNKPDEVAGLAYRLDKTHYEYFDGQEKALREQLEKLVPYSHSLGITSRSKDSKSMTISNSGPQDPGTYYLVKDGKLTTIGTRNPRVKKEDLAKVDYVKYKSRDGKVIRAFVTIPHGEAPFPTIVLPHGGPFVQEVVGYDEWGQMLANNGYLVIQPQYRGSLGFGLDFFKSSFLPKGEGGHAMQDDKDDGVKYLIKKGLADPKRVAMFGWSYGGYAALIAASRTDQLYQCVIAGAAVADMMLQANYYIDRLRGSQKVQQIRYRNDSISPINEVEKVNIPILLIHGSVDQRVPPEHAKRYLKQLDKYNKPYEYLELEGADHFSSTLFYHHKIKLYETMIEYLKNKCGPGGL